MSDLTYRVWFCRWTPTELVQLHPSLSLTLRDGEEWFETLVKDIDKNGLMNPILVHNQTAPTDENTPNRVAHGSNRFRAIKRLGWKYIPCLIVGQLPSYFRKGGAVELHSVEEVQSYIHDGTFISKHKYGSIIRDSKFAQTMEYIRQPEPYFDKKD